jgi:hypothetical protein
MRCVRIISAACCVTAGTVLNVHLGAADPTLTEIVFSGFLTGGINAPTSLHFSGTDLWRKGGSAYGGMTWSPGGLNNDGFTLKLLLAGGDYLYQSGINNIRGTDVLASVLPGYRFKNGNLEIKAFAGLDIQHHWTLPDDPSNELRGTHVGARFNIDAWWEPFPAQIMLATTLTGSTIGSNYGVRGAAGWRAFDSFWTGPEIETSGDEVYRQYRVEAHVTSLKFGDFEWAFGAGYVQDNNDRSGMYGRFSLLTRR